ncbi:MAG: ABC-F family ATP-binding cassette domain-containing protein [Anaerolineales bacterium]|nr:ABC-F family ATP-binding cassette domain-containing protein [Anaerolineales bacterium]
MSLITAYQISKSYGPVDIFTGLSLQIPPDGRIALVGANGIGKTTLLRVLADLESPSGGKIQRASGLQIGFLPQEAKLSSDLPLWEEVLSALEFLRRREKELQELEQQMENPGKAAEEEIERYGRLQAEFERKGGYTYESRVDQVLGGLGFSPEDYQRPLSKLSGGQRTRVFLAKLLLSNNDLLILDEPTNHLDIQAIQWLEGYLKTYPGGILLVSHDRYFIDEVCTHIWEMSRSGFEIYRGNYSAYLNQRQDRWARRQELFEAEKARLENELDYVKRNIAGQRTSQAKGKLRRLSRRVQAIEQIGIQAIQGKNWGEISEQVETTSSPLSVQEAHRRIQSLQNPVQQPQNLSLDLKTRRRGGDLVIRTHQLEIGYPDGQRALFSVPDITLHRGECAALIGPNGAGKTSFLKTILGQLEPWSGEVTIGANLDIGYFAQAHEDLHPDYTLGEEIRAAAPGMLDQQVRDYLARYLFRGDEVFKKVSVLSGGERGRIALAKLALSDANLLLLDEPTNHLDIPSQEILQSVLGDYPGTILLVSHDRYLINALATQIWKIDPDERGLDLFEGDYQAYQKHLREKALSEPEQKAGEDLPAESYREQKAAKNRALAAERRRENRLEEVVKRITELENQLEELGAALVSPPDDPGEIVALGKRYGSAEDELEDLLKEWESLAG